MINRRSLLFFALGAFAVLNADMSAIKGQKNIDLNGDTKGVTAVINSGVSFNQQIASSSLNSTASAAANGGQFVIKKSGRYFLSTDIIANPVASAPIIYIACSDVVLDLGGKTLTITSTTSLKGCVGVQVATGMNNVTIFNGTISGASAPNPTARLRTGIQCYGVNGAPCANIIIDNVDVTGCGFRGIDLAYCDSAIIDETVVQGTRGCLCIDEDKSALFMDNCTDSIVRDSVFNYTQVFYPNPGLTAYGVYLNQCSNINFKNVSASNNRGAGLVGSSAVGVYLAASTACTFENVRAVANQITGGTPSQIKTSKPVAGFLLNTGSICNVFTDCVANNNLAMSGALTCSAYGFRMTNSSGQNNFVRCIGSNNSGITAQGFSAYASGKNTFKECIADSNNAYASNSFATAAGFSVAFSRGNTFIKCEASGNAVGFLPNPSQYQTANGILFWTESNSVIRDSSFSANGIPGQSSAYGIHLAGSCNTCVIGFNEMIANAGLQQYGYKDDALSTTTMLRGNVSFGHGACYAGGTSYLLNSTKTNYWFVFSEALGVMNVQNMIKEADIANMNAFEAGNAIWFNFSVLDSPISG